MFETNRKIIPAVALRDLIVYPAGSLYKFSVGRSKTIKAIEKAMKTDKLIFVTNQIKPEIDNPTYNDLYKIGTLCKIQEVLPQNDRSITVSIMGIKAYEIIDFLKEKPFFEFEIICCDEDIIHLNHDQITAGKRTIIDKFEEYILINQKVPIQVLTDARDISNIEHLMYFLLNAIPTETKIKQKFLEEMNVATRCVEFMQLLEKEITICEYQEDLDTKVNKGIQKNQREYFLREKLKVVLEELGEGEHFLEELDNYKKTIQKLDIEEKSKETLLREVSKIKRLGPASQEGGNSRNYIDFVLSLPFSKETKDKLDLARAKKVLDAEHYGLEKVKERILETLALRAISDSKKGCVICLSGPPGVGKTTIAKSISKAIGRNFARVSLGGVRDESAIRGHRRTYIGAMSGRIIRAMSDAKSSNPVILLDEIEKMASDMRGDPSAAMLEVLDFAQNDTFLDHYVDIPYDLSKVIFITTANDLGAIPKPLRDRMEIIELKTYTQVEKFHIAKEHIIPKILKKHNLKRIKFTDYAINDIIENYTRESGVRRLEQLIEKAVRKIAFIMIMENKKTFIVDENVTDFIGKRIYSKDMFSKENQVGIVNGLAYTSVGGTILQVEVNVFKGDGKMQLTGNLGKVMQESASIALSYIKSICDDINVPIEFFKQNDIHIHFPEGAVPKDGPSAGITMATAIISAITKREVLSTVAMTGEVSLRGKVMPIGGLAEKSMAGYQNGIKKILISKENEKDLEDIDKEVLENVEFVIVNDMKEVIKHALVENTEQIAEEIINKILI